MNYKDKKIFVVDDMATMRQAVVTLLRKAGFVSIQQSINGVDAIEKIRALYDSGEKLDMIFSDINMPEMNGIELLQELKRDPVLQNIPVVMISTENESAIVIDAISKGATNYIIKPFTSDTLNKKLEELKKFLQ